MGLCRVTGKRPDYVLVVVQYYIQYEVYATYAARFLYIFPYGISLQPCRYRPGAGHFAVIALYCSAGGYSRHYGLGPAAVTGEVVILYISEAYPSVGFGYCARYINGGSAGGCAKVYTVIGITVHAAYFLPGSFAGQRFPLLIGMMAVAAYCEHEGYVLWPRPAAVKLIQQRRHYF